MDEDLPELGEIFFTQKNELSSNEKKIGKIELQLSKEANKWIDAEFIDIAIGGIGIHVLLPIQLELSASELGNVKLRFIKRSQLSPNPAVLKQLPVLIRWQETDTLTGNLKLGVHFGADAESDTELKELLKAVRKQKLA